MMSAGMMTAVLLGTNGSTLASIGGSALFGLVGALGLAIASAVTVRMLQRGRRTTAPMPVSDELPLAA
jgi:hypothetical protein